MRRRKESAVCGLLYAARGAVPWFGLMIGVENVGMRYGAGSEVLRGIGFRRNVRPFHPPRSRGAGHGTSQSSFKISL